MEGLESKKSLVRKPCNLVNILKIYTNKIKIFKYGLIKKII